MLHNFLNSNDDPNVKSTVVLMDEVIQQTNIGYLSLLENMKNGNIEDEDVDFIIGKCLDPLSPEDNESFKHVIHLVLQWKMAHPIVKQYLESLMTTIAKNYAKYNSCRDDGKNHSVKDSSMCGRFAIYVAWCNRDVIEEELYC